MPRWLPLLLALSACSSHANPEPLADALPILPLPWLDLPANASIAGTVRDPHGVPVPGAHVCAWHHAPGQRRDNDTTPRCTTSDSAGAFVLAQLEPAAYHVHTSAPTYRPGGLASPVPARAARHTEGIDLTLTPGGAPLTGQVIDLQGAPISGAWVTNFSLREPSQERGAIAAGQTDRDGRFTLWLTPGPHHVEADAPGFTASRVFLDATTPPARLQLVPESIITGLVIDAVTRAPVAGARVRVRPAELARTADDRFAYTDAAGRYSLTRLPPGTLVVIAEAGNRRGDGDRDIPLGLGQTFTLPPIAVSSLPSVQARVTDCHGGYVDLGDGTHEPIGPDGEVFLPALTPGPRKLVVVCPGRTSPPHTIDLGAAPLTDLTWATDRLSDPDPNLVAAKSSQIHGVVVDLAGRPVPRASVSLQGANIDLPSTETATPGGSFTLHSVEPGEYTIVATRPDSGYEPDAAASQPLRVTGGTVSGVRLALPADPAAIHGRVVRDDVPLAGVVVAANQEKFLNDLQSLHWSFHEVFTVTDANGRFVLDDGHIGGTHSLWVYAPGRGALKVRRVANGSDITVQVPRPAALAGALIDPVPALTRFAVSITNPIHQIHVHRLFERTDSRWAFEDLPDGEYEVRVVSRSGCSTTRVTLGEGERREDLALALERPTGVRGRVVHGDTREPVADIDVRINHDDLRVSSLESDLGSFTAKTDADGRFELLGVCPGALDIRASTGATVGAARVSADAGHVADVSLALVPGNSD